MPLYRINSLLINCIRRCLPILKVTESSVLYGFIVCGIVMNMMKFEQSQLICIWKNEHIVTCHLPRGSKLRLRTAPKPVETAHWLKPPTHACYRTKGSLAPCLVAAWSPGWFVGDPTPLARDNI